MPLRDRFAFLLLIAAAALAERPVYACGPDFPGEYLSFRVMTLADLPEGVFAYEAMRLVPAPADSFRLTEEEAAKARVGGGVRETALYQEGAQAFRAGDQDKARTKFLEVMALPAAERRRLSTLAAFMLGRLAETPEEARQRFAEVRDLARKGFEDPLALAVASYGEEARLLLHKGDDAGAIKLYAEQAALGSQSGVISLLFVTRALVGDPRRLKRALRDPVGQRLLTSYAWTRLNDSWNSGDSSAHPPRDLLDTLAAEPSLAGADRLAAAAWRGGRFELAERFAHKEETALSLWVRAKLAVRKGDWAEAERLMGQTIGRLSGREGSARDVAALSYLAQRATAEEGILALTRGDFAAAFPRVIASCVWPDIAYLAERVLTVDELRSFLATDLSSLKSRCVATDEGYWETRGIPFSDRLRRLLARRLMRADRYREALPFFEGDAEAEAARQYAEARERALRSRDKIDRARALFEAARIARRKGLEILGTEVWPDWGWVAGQYDLGQSSQSRQADQFGFGRADEFGFNFTYDGAKGAYEKGQDAFLKMRAKAIKLSPDVTLVTGFERARAALHAPPHSERFHYRETAADLAEQAAALVPERSQAYAVLLCHAARFVAFMDQDRVERLWKTYVRRGALIAERWEFGVSCPEPNFDRAGQPPRQKRIWPWSKWRRRTIAGGIALLVALGVALGLLAVRHRRRKL